MKKNFRIRCQTRHSCENINLFLTFTILLCQITRSHYQNAVTATRMDSSPQTPDADARPAEGNTPTPDPPTSEQSTTLMPPPHPTTMLMPPPREPGRLGSARAHGPQSGVLHSTSLLNEKNRIVSKSTDGERQLYWFKEQRFVVE